MSRKEIQNIILSYLKNYKPEFVGLFGSFARADKSTYGDIDILVRFPEHFSLLQLLKIENELSDKIGVKVDLVTEGALINKRIKTEIYKDLQIIYEA